MAAKAATIQMLVIITALATHQRQIAWMTKSSRYVK